MQFTLYMAKVPLGEGQQAGKFLEISEDEAAGIFL
jgi:hypothetical protein